MGKDKKLKKIVAILLFCVGTLANIIITAYLHLLLTDEIKIIGIGDSIQIIKTDPKAVKLFLLIEILVITLSLFYFFMKDTFYESELIEITPKIKIPKPAGQMQFGSAWFATKEEIEESFTVCDMDKIKINNIDKLKRGERNKAIKRSIFERWHSSRIRRRS